MMYLFYGGMGRLGRGGGLDQGRSSCCVMKGGKGGNDPDGLGTWMSLWGGVGAGRGGRDIRIPVS